jgi:hypothetical protein
MTYIDSPGGTARGPPGCDVRAAGRWQLDRDPYLLEMSVPGIFAYEDPGSGLLRSTGLSPAHLCDGIVTIRSHP